MERYDVIVAGLGAMGSATAARLALRGTRVLGLERWSPGHVHGSSHGDTRIIREMYFEHPMYVPLVQRAYELWRDLEARTGRPLLAITGGLMVGPADGTLVPGTLRSAREHGLPYEMIDAAAMRSRFPAFTLPDGCVAVYDPRAGHVHPDGGNAAHHEVARNAGADLRFDEPLTSWQADGAGVRVTTPKGTYLADRLCLSVGAYLGPLARELGLPLEVERQVLFWFDTPEADTRWLAPACPIWIHEHAAGIVSYGFPRRPRGVKMGVMHDGEIAADAEAVRRTVDARDLQAVRDAVGGMLPDIRTAAVRESATCLFTNTPDHDFIIAPHPAHPQVLVSSACSGHGYKFASAIGEVQADLLTAGTSRFDLAPFGLARLARA